ncbi:MAG: hypothetical protein WC829_11430 [Hyphomicrobium sp.]
MANLLRRGADAGARFDNTLLKAATAQANTLSYPGRALGGVAADAFNELAGRAPRYDAGQTPQGMIAPQVSSPFAVKRPALPAPIAPANAAPAPAPPARPVSPVDPRIQPWNSPASAVPSAPNAAALVPGMRTLDGRAGGLASSVGQFGENVYDNASIARLNARSAGAYALPAAAPAAAPVVAGAAPGSATAAVASGQSSLTRDPAAPQNNFGGYQANDAGAYASAVQPPVLSRVPANYGAPSTGLSGNTYAAEQERKARLSELDSQYTALGSLNSRGKRELAAQIMGLKAQLTGAALSQAGDLAKVGADLNSKGAIAALGLNAAVDESGATLAHTSRENALTRQLEARKIGKTLTADDGTESALSFDGQLQRLLNPDGSPFRRSPTSAEGAVTESDQFEAANDFDMAELQSLIPGTPEADRKGAEIRKRMSDRIAAARKAKR